MRQRMRQALLRVASMEMSGRDLRSSLNRAGWNFTLAGFYSMMAGLQEEGLVEWEYNAAKAGGVLVPEVVYRITQKGRTALGLKGYAEEEGE